MIYIGNGAFMPGVPARDLTEDEVKKYGGAAYLVSTGLYKLPVKPAEKRGK